MLVRVRNFRLIGSAAPTPPQGFLMPLGIPDFPWDFQESIPTLPSPWNSSTTGFYYVKQGGAAGDNGTPSAPRGSLPNMSTIPDGSVVVLDNTADLTGTNFSINPVGTSGAKIWFVGSGQVGLGSGSTPAVIRYTGDFSISAGSQWFIIDGIDFFCNSANQVGWSASRCSNYVIRNFVIRGNGQDRIANSSNFIGGSSTSSRSEFGMLYNGTIKDLGLYTHSGGDIDCHGIQIGQWTNDHWFIDNTFEHNQGDGLQITGASNPSSNTPSVVQRLYAGRNTFNENLQTGFWAKTGDIIIFSENTVSNHTDGGGSAPVGCGGQYDFTNYWLMFNRILDNPNGIRFASNNNGVSPVIRVLGNVITGCTASSGVQTGSAFSDGVGVGFWQGGSEVAVEFNTISGFNGHGITATNGSGNDIRIENNIVRGRTNSSCFDVFVESVSTQPKVRNNSFPASPRFSVNGSTTTSVSAFQSASSTNRSDNLSGAISVVNDVTGSSGDFDVVDGSATIGAGALNTDLFAEYLSDYSLDIKVDFEKVVRPQATIDIGAHEH